ncbi:methyltransferase [bacterium]|nr:methyltransferase [bacterium]
MTSRERVKQLLNHQKADRVAIDFGATPVTGIAVNIVAKLRQAVGLDKPGGNRVKVIEPYQMLGEIDEELIAKLHIDCIGLSGKKNLFGFENKDWKPWQLFDGTPVLVPGLFNTEPEENGDILMYPEGDKSAPPSGRMPKNGFYFDTIVRQGSIDEKNLKVEYNLEEFQQISDEELKCLDKQTENLYTNTDLAIVANFGGTGFGDIALVPAPFLKYPKGIRDIEEWYISTLTRKGFIYEIFERQCEIALQNLEKIRQAVGNKIEVIFISGTDFGTQRGLFISANLYKELYKPFHKKVNDWVHTHTDWKTFIHSCGSVEPLILEFIDAGFDILNPVQCSAANMDPKYLKEKYGSKIVFWGGGVDSQKTLPFGTPNKVRKEVKDRIEIFNQDGGFVFNAVHNIQANTPVENVIALFEALRAI